jgi:hypothetical protein
LESRETAEYLFEPGRRYVCDPDGIPTGTMAGGGHRGSHWIVCETMPGGFCIEPLSGPVNGLATDHYTTVEPGSPLSMT